MMPASNILHVLLVGGDEAADTLLQEAGSLFPALRVESVPATTMPSHPSIASAEVMILHRVRWPSGGLGEASACRCIIHLGAGSGCDLEEARERGIFVCSLPGLSAEEVAETVAPILQEFLVSGKPAGATPRGRQFRRPRLGLIGLGRLGREIARAARDRKYELWAYDPFALEEDFIQAGARPTHQLEDALGIPDLVCVQVAPAEGNRHMISAGELAALRRDAWLVNIGWGPAVEAPAALQAVSRGRLAQWIPGGDPAGISLSEQLEASRQTVSAPALSAALELASLIARGEDPTPLLIDPPCPRWEP